MNNNTGDLIAQWAKAKGIYADSTPLKQLEKLLEEVDELRAELLTVNAGCDPVNAHLEIGDCMVVLENIARMLGSTGDQCRDAAYAKISKRSGQMVDGLFVKDASDAA